MQEIIEKIALLAHQHIHYDAANEAWFEIELFKGSLYNFLGNTILPSQFAPGEPEEDGEHVCKIQKGEAIAWVALRKMKGYKMLGDEFKVLSHAKLPE